MRLRLSKLALDDLDSIFAYTVAKWGEEQADKYAREIWRSILNLVETPERWRLRNSIYPGCRICLTGRHAVLYRIREGQVEVARILHGAMDFRRHITSNFFGED